MVYRCGGSAGFSPDFPFNQSDFSDWHLKQWREYRQDKVQVQAKFK